MTTPAAESRKHDRRWDRMPLADFRRVVIRGRLSARIRTYRWAFRPDYALLRRDGWTRRAAIALLLFSHADRVAS